MQLLSLNNMFEGAKGVVLRFPVAISVCIVATALAIATMHIDDPERFAKLLLTFTFAAPLFVGAVLYGQIKPLMQKHQAAIHVGIFVFLSIYYVLLPEPAVALDTIFIRHTMWTIGFILLVTFISFTHQRGAKAISRFWQYNRGLLFTIALTGLWAGALQAGISAALASVDFLFDIRIDEEMYMDVWLVIVGVFAPLFFLHRLPEAPEKLDTRQEYPKEVRLFSQFVLVPLTTLYFLILYAYTGRILLSGTWPEGQVSWMILGFSFVGVLAYLALHPLREKTAWVRHFGTGLFVAMIPQTGMLFWALWFRLRDYGFTENRYFVLVFGVWLLTVAIYLLASKAKDIRLIPMTLFLIAVVMSVGPWGAFETAKRSQYNRLEGILMENNLLQDGLYVQASADLTDEDVIEINEIVRYLNQRHGLDSIEPWFDGEDLDGLANARWEVKDKVIEDYFGLEVMYPRAMRYEFDSRDSTSFNLFVDPMKSSSLSISGYDHMVDLGQKGIEIEETFTIGSRSFETNLDMESQELRIREGGDVVLTFDISSLIEKAQAAHAGTFTREETSTLSESETMRALVSVENLFGEEIEGELNVYSFDALLFVTLK